MIDFQNTKKTYPNYKKYKRRKKLLYYNKRVVAFAAIILLITIISAQFLNKTSSSNNQSLSINKSEASVNSNLSQQKQAIINSNNSSNQKVDSKINQLQSDINDLITEYQDKGLDNASIIIKDNSFSETININQDTVMQTASLYKLFVLWEMERQIALGKISDDTLMTLNASNDGSSDDGGSLGPYGSTISVKDAKHLMIEQSNNTAALCLIQLLNVENIKSTLKNNGLSDTTIWPNQSSSASDVFTVINGIYTKNLDKDLKETNYDDMIQLLKNQTINNEISEGLPKGTIFAHKTGNLDSVVHDAGIIYFPNKNISIVAMTKGSNYASYGFLYKLGQLVTNTFS